MANILRASGGGPVFIFRIADWGARGASHGTSVVVAAVVFVGKVIVAGGAGGSFAGGAARSFVGH